MRVTVCEFPDVQAALEETWSRLESFLRREAESDLVVLPELFAAGSFWAAPAFDRDVWRHAISAHDDLIQKALPRLNARRVMATRPVEHQGRRHNEAFLWSRTEGYQRLRAKYHLPEQAGGWEKTWFDPGERDVTAVGSGDISVAAMVCSEIMANQAAVQLLGRSNVDIVAVPRATGNHPRWEVALRMTAISSGAYVASSNRSGADSSLFGGRAMLIGPDGDVIGETSGERPFVTCDIDPAAAGAAKKTYPRNIRDKALGPVTGRD